MNLAGARSSAPAADDEAGLFLASVRAPRMPPRMAMPRSPDDVLFREAQSSRMLSISYRSLRRRVSFAVEGDQTPHST